jgi:tetratricopeptide (TPR) repeat protein
LIAIGAVTLLVAMLMARSTGGTAACFVGLVAVLVLGWSRWRRSPQRLATLAVIGLAGVCVTALVVPPEGWLDFGKYSRKLLLVRWSLPLVRDYFAFGTGRGAFETVFPAYRQGTFEGMPNQVVFTHPENLLVQWVGEWGVPVAAVACLAIAWLLLRGLRKRSISLSGVCIAGGIGCVILQNMVDLGLELSGIAVAVALLLGTLVASPGRAPEPGSFPLGRGTTFLALAVATIVCAGVGLGRYGVRLAWQERDVAYESLLAVKGKPAENQGFFEGLKAQARRRPAEPYFALVAAQGSQRLDMNAMPWIARAIERDPARGETYLVLARELARHGQRAQALGALRYGIEQDETQMERALRLAHAISSDADELVHGAPDSALGTTFLLRLAATSDYDLRSKLVTLAFERAPHSVHALAAQGRLLCEALNTGKPECAGEQEAHCIARVQELVVLLRKADAADFAWLELSSQLLAYQGRNAEAVAALQQGCRNQRDPAPCLGAAVALASDSNNIELVESAVSDFLRAVCGSSLACARGEVEAGRALMRAGAYFKAFEHYQRSAEIQPSPGVWRKAAQAARAAGLEVRANAADRKAARLASGAREVAPSL